MRNPDWKKITQNKMTKNKKKTPPYLSHLSSEVKKKHNKDENTLFLYIFLN